MNFGRLIAAGLMTFGRSVFAGLTGSLHLACNLVGLILIFSIVAATEFIRVVHTQTVLVIDWAQAYVFEIEATVGVICVLLFAYLSFALYLGVVG